MASELRHRTTKKKEEEIVPDDIEEEDEGEEEDRLVEQVDKEEPIEKVKPKTRARKKEEVEDTPMYGSKKMEYTVAVVRMILILVVFTVLHGWVTKYVLDPYFGRDQSNFQFNCPPGMDCSKIREHLEKVHIRE